MIWYGDYGRGPHDCPNTMNIFILDTNPVLCAQYHNDKHVVKMITESVQLLSTAARIAGVDEGYAITHRNHPCNIWVRSSRWNYIWLRELAYALEEEWKYRYEHPKSRRHKAMEILETIPFPYALPDKDITPFTLAMPEQYKSDSAVESYRQYYIHEKQHIAQWRKRGQPHWYTT